MCISPPSVPKPVERQAAKLPDAGQGAANLDALRARRLAYASTILTSPTGVTGSQATTRTATTGA
jgi:hypothetical protein